MKILHNVFKFHIQYFTKLKILNYDSMKENKYFKKLESLILMTKNGYIYAKIFM